LEKSEAFWEVQILPGPTVRPTSSSHNNMELELFPLRNPTFSNLRFHNIKKFDKSFNQQM